MQDVSVPNVRATGRRGTTAPAQRQAGRRPPSAAGPADGAGDPLGSPGSGSGTTYEVNERQMKGTVVSLLSHGIAVGIGYLLGTPQGRQRLNEVGRQAGEIAQRPEVARLQERGKALVAEKTEVVKQKVADRKASASSADAAGVEGTGDAVRPRRNLQLPARLRRRSGTAHFPESTGVTPPESLGGTTVMEDSEAALLGTPVAPRTDPPATSGR